MQYAVLADGLGRPLTAEELDELIRLLDQAGNVTRDPATGAAIAWTPSAWAAQALRSQRIDGKTLLTIPRECRGFVLETLHFWVGEVNSARVEELRYALHAELVAEVEAA